MVERTRRRRPTDRRFYPRRKVCSFCVDHVRYIDYKDASRLRRFISDWAKIESRRKTGTCSRHQRGLTQALKRARHMALIPFTGSHTLVELGRFEGPRSDRFRSDRRPETGTTEESSGPVTQAENAEVTESEATAEVSEPGVVGENDLEAADGNVGNPSS